MHPTWLPGPRNARGTPVVHPLQLPTSWKRQLTSNSARTRLRAPPGGGVISAISRVHTSLGVNQPLIL